MDTIFLIIRLALAMIFAVAGIAKLRDVSGSRNTMSNFGAPGPVAGIAGMLLPLVELAIAVFLVPTRTYWWSAIVACGLLILFSCAIGFQLARGRRPTCNCFGQVNARPIGLGTLARNGVLWIMSLALIVHGWGEFHPESLNWVDEMSSGELLILATSVTMLALLGLLACMMIATIRSLSDQVAFLTSSVSAINARSERKRQGEYVAPIMGEPAPHLEIPDFDGNLVDLTDRKGRELVMVFSRPGCKPCRDLVPDLHAYANRSDPALPELIVVTKGSAGENPLYADLKAEVLLSPGDSTALGFGAPGSPSVVRIDANGNIASDVVLGTRSVRAFLLEIVNGDAVDVSNDEVAPVKKRLSFQGLASKL
jgi:hypothetical protein